MGREWDLPALRRNKKRIAGTALGMTGYFFLDWALLSVSLFDAILMFWLGLTVLLNAELQAPPGRSSRWGVWIAGISFQLGAVFFLAHTVILGLGLDQILPGLEIWWRVGWVPLIALPFTWYAEMLWYAGFWEEQNTRLARRHRPWFFVCLWLGALGILGALATDPLPLVNAWESAGPTFGNTPLFLLLYPAYIIACILLAFDTQWRPGPTSRLMGDRARQRARPWLSGVAITFLAVCLLVGFAMVWILRSWFPQIPTRAAVTEVMMLDLVIASLIGLATAFLGQSIIVYEVFTGHILPRRGLTIYWRNAFALSAVFSILIGGSLASYLSSMYSLMMIAFLGIAAYALQAWSSYRQRDEYITSLRPFITSQQLLERLTEDAPALPALDTAGPFRALCSEILNTRRAALICIGPMAPLWGAPLVYPDDSANPLPVVSISCEPPSPLAVALDPNHKSGLRWMVPLWSQRGPIGALLLGEKLDGGLYAREDFEIAQSACERLIDSHASAELARRLVLLQRERLVGSQVTDRRTRRVLHDEILPALHAALLSLDRAVGSQSSAMPGMQELAATHQQIARLLQAIPPPPQDIASLGLLPSLRRIVDSEMPEAFEEIQWNIDPAAAAAAHALPAFSIEVLYFAARELIRNAAQHARGEYSERRLTLALGCRLRTNMLELTVEDDGAGFQTAASSVTGQSGHGLTLHGTMMAVIGGELLLQAQSGGGTHATLRLPL
jgi:signal transduction histidine kinase